MKILSVQGSFTLVPDAKPLTSTYLSLVNGLNTYPGFPGTGFPVGNEGVGAEARDDEIPVDGCAVSRCVVRWSASDDDRRWPRLSTSPRDCACDAEAISGGGTVWPGLVTSDGMVSVTAVDDDDSLPPRRVA
jgi:hypothetical protein